MTDVCSAGAPGWRGLRRRLAMDSPSRPVFSLVHPLVRPIGSLCLRQHLQLGCCGGCLLPPPSSPSLGGSRRGCRAAAVSPRRPAAWRRQDEAAAASGGGGRRLRTRRPPPPEGGGRRRPPPRAEAAAASDRRRPQAAAAQPPHGRRLGEAAAACPTLVRRPTLGPPLPIWGKFLDKCSGQSELHLAPCVKHRGGHTRSVVARRRDDPRPLRPQSTTPSTSGTCATRETWLCTRGLPRVSDASACVRGVALQSVKSTHLLRCWAGE